MIPDYIQQVHDDIFGVLSGDAYLADVPIFRSRTPLVKDANGNPITGQSTVIDDEIAKALSGVKKRNGKGGIAVIVLLPDVDPEGEDSLGPDLAMKPKVRVIENRLFNEGSTGTGLASSQVALHIVQLLHRRALRGGTYLRPDPRKMIEEIPLPDDEVAQEVTMICSQGVDPLVQAGFPQAAQAGAQITLSSSTPDAAIYYTTDQTWPGQGSATALLYSVPFTLADGDHIIRACAYKEGLSPSNDLWAEINVTTP